MAHFLKDEEYIILEKSDKLCDFLRKFPRQRKLISINKSKDLRYDWNSLLGSTMSLRDYTSDLYPSVDPLIMYMEDFASKNKIKIRFNFEVKSIEKKDDKFVINGGEYVADRVFFGIGLVPREPDFEPDKKLTVYTYANMPLNPELYMNKNVVIFGTGNAAFETAEWLQPHARTVLLAGRSVNAWQTHHPGHLRSKNYGIIDSYFLKSRVGFIWDLGNNRKFKESYQYKTLVKCLSNIEYSTEMFDIIIFCTGFTFDDTLVKKLVDIDPVTNFPILNSNYESTKCPGLYFIGANGQNEDYKKGTSAFIHGFRYNCQYMHRVLSNNVEYTLIKSNEKKKSVDLHYFIASTTFAISSASYQMETMNMSRKYQLVLLGHTRDPSGLNSSQFILDIQGS